MARTILEVIADLFASDKAVVDENGKRLVDFDALKPIVEGNDLFDDGELKGTASKEEYDEVEAKLSMVTREEFDNLNGLMVGVTEADYPGLITALEARISAMEALIIPKTKHVVVENDERIVL